MVLAVLTDVIVKSCLFVVFTVLTDDIVKSMLCRGLSSLHTVALSVPCSAVTDTSLSLIGT